MKQGQVSKSFFCGWCGAPAVGARASALGEPFRGYWAHSCPHAAPVVRMGPKARAQVVARHEVAEARERASQRQAIADCAGEPVNVEA